jgi:hypothetical protein
LSPKDLVIKLRTKCKIISKVWGKGENLEYNSADFSRESLRSDFFQFPIPIRGRKMGNWERNIGDRMKRSRGWMVQRRFLAGTVRGGASTK